MYLNSLLFLIPDCDCLAVNVQTCELTIDAAACIEGILPSENVTDVFVSIALSDSYCLNILSY